MRAEGWATALVVVGLVGAAATAVTAQETIASDRPGIGSGSFVLERGTVQLEGGVDFSVVGHRDVYSVGQLLLRAGLDGPVEIHALVNSYQIVRGEGPEEEGLQDLGVGLKVRLTPQDSEGASISLLGTVSFPSGDDGVTADETVPAFTALADFGLGERGVLSVNAGYSFEVGSVSDVFSIILTPAVSLARHPEIGIYGGYAGLFSDPEDLHFAEVGLTWLKGADLQLDLNGGLELASGDFFVGAGAAKRWPWK